MELKQYKKTSHDYTAKSSEIARQLNFAGIGIIWIIKTTYPELKLNSNLELLLPLAFIAISLVLDFLHYFIGGIIWISFYKQKEKEGIANNTDIKTSEWRSHLLYSFYYAKFFLMFIAYCFIIQTIFIYY